jgi:hypothetical protein
MQGKIKPYLLRKTNILTRLYKTLRQDLECSWEAVQLHACDRFSMDIKALERI